MTSPVDPVGIGQTVIDANDRNTGDRRQGDRRQRKDDSSKAVVATGKVTSAKPASVAPAPPAAFAAQVLGQPGRKRGLKGGPEVLDTARTTYLSREFSGQKDRRPPLGVRKNTDI